MVRPTLFDPIRCVAVARKEIRQLRRDPRSLLLAFALPLLLIALFGYAISWDVREIRLAVVDQDRSSPSRALVEAFEASSYFEVVARPDSPEATDELLTRGRAQLVLIVPPGFASARDRAAAVQIVLDGSDANSATIAAGYAEAVVTAFDRRRSSGTTPVSPLTIPQTRVWYNEELSSRNMIVPGLIAVIMMVIAALLTSLTVAREWERGTMEQLASTPVSRLELVLGKLAPYLGIGLLDVVGSALLAVFLFEVPFRGGVLLLAVHSLLFLAGSLGLGLFISAATRSQVLATQVSMLATFLPAFLLSGFMFSIAVMPRPLQLISLLVPARYFLVVVRGVFLKGLGAADLAPQAALMVAYAVLGLGLALASFRKELQ